MQQMKGQVVVLITARTPVTSGGTKTKASGDSLITLSPLEVKAAISEASSQHVDIEADSEDEDAEDIVLLLTGLAAKDLVDTGSRC